MMLKDRTLLAAVLLIVACAFGGGGSEAGLANLAVQLGALLILALHPRAFFDFFRSAPRFPVLLVVCAIVLPLLQIIPLPPFLWQALPGRDLVRDGLELVGAGDSWFPMSLEWRRTFLAFLSLIPALTIIVLVWSQPEGDKSRLLIVVVALGGLLVMLGAQQLVTGNRRLMFFSENIGTADLHGWFANRNSAGLFLTIALTALVGLFPERRPGMKWVLGAGAVAALLVLGLILTRSRSSMALALVPFAFAIFRLARHHAWNRLSGKVILASLLGVAVLLGGGAALLSQNPQIRQSLVRFENLNDHRPLIWEDTIPAIGRYWPAGSGIGTFDETFQIDESLENLSPGRAGRAHNDFLEITLESGIAGVALAVAWVAFLCLRSVQAIRAGRICCSAAGVLLVIGLQSVSDYPLRNQTLLCIAGLALALLIQAPVRRQIAPSEKC